MISEIRKQYAMIFRATGWKLIRRNWKHAADEIRVTWGKLSDEDLTAIGGRREQLVATLHNRYGGQLSLAEHKIDQFASRMEAKLSGPLSPVHRG